MPLFKPARHSAVVAVLVSLFLLPAVSSGDSSEWPLDGRVVSANVSGAGSSGGTSVLISAAQIGAGNVFVVQTWCVNTNAGAASLYPSGSQNGFGGWTLVQDGGVAENPMICKTFWPGYVVPAGQDLMVQTSSNNLYSNVSGIITADPALVPPTPTPTSTPNTTPTSTPCVGIDCGIFGV